MKCREYTPQPRRSLVQGHGAADGLRHRVRQVHAGASDGERSEGPSPPGAPPHHARKRGSGLKHEKIAGAWRPRLSLSLLAAILGAGARHGRCRPDRPSDRKAVEVAAAREQAGRSRARPAHRARHRRGPAVHRRRHGLRGQDLLEGRTVPQILRPQGRGPRRAVLPVRRGRAPATRSSSPTSSISGSRSSTGKGTAARRLQGAFRSGQGLRPGRRSGSSSRRIRPAAETGERLLHIFDMAGRRRLGRARRARPPPTRSSTPSGT